MQSVGAQRFRAPFIVVTTLFFIWGFITVLVDALIPHLKALFELTYFQAGLAQFAFFTAYFVVSIPGGVLISRIGYKRGVVFGLLTMGAGCLLFYPAAALRSFEVFLLALFVLAAGITTLQVAANPYVAALGPPRTASSRLNLAQAFNSLGTTLSPLFSAAFILSTTVLGAQQIGALTAPERQAYYAQEASAVQLPFVAIAVVLMLLALAFSMFNLPKILEGDGAQHGSYRRAFRHRRLMLGAIGIFVYVGAEVAIGSYMVNYLESLELGALIQQSEVMRGLANLVSGGAADTANVKQIAGAFLAFYWGGAMIGRFVGSALLQVVQPRKLLTLYAAIAVALLALTIVSSGLVAVWSVLAIGLFNSVMFPTIFTLAIDGLGDNTAQGSGILCTAIVGGAIIPPLYGALADGASLQLAFLLPMACYAYIIFYGLWCRRFDGAEAEGRVRVATGH